MKIKTVSLRFLLFVVVFFILTILENGWIFDDPIRLLSPLIWAVSLATMVFLPNTRRIFIYISFILLSAMVIFYLFNLINLANWLGSLGFGELVLLMICYFPKLFKNGFIEKF